MTKLAAIIILLLPLQLNAETLCSKSGNAAELSISEEKYNLESALQAINEIKDNLQKTDDVNAFERQLGYLNRLAIIKGTLLKQNVLNLKIKYLKSGANKDKLDYEKSLVEFCEMVSKTSYVD